MQALPAAGRDAGHDVPFETVARAFDGVLEAELVQAWIARVLEAYGPHILRIKGLLHLAGHDRPAVLQYGRNRIAAIGSGIHPDLLDEALAELVHQARGEAAATPVAGRP